MVDMITLFTITSFDCRRFVIRSAINTSTLVRTQRQQHCKFHLKELKSQRYCSIFDLDPRKMSQTKRTLASLSSDTHETAKHLQNSNLTKTTKFPKNCEGHNDENRYRTEFKDAHLNVFLSSNANFDNYTTIKVHKKDDQLVNDSMVMVDGILMKEEEAIKLKWERQMRKVRAADRASNTKVTKEDHLHILHLDEHFVAVNKPSGILCVPGIHCHDSLLTLVHKEIGSSLEKLEQMIVHRLDMDTSGVVLFARTMEAMSALHAIFRERKVSKIYEALVCGHIKQDVQSGTIDLPLQRDHAHPPFMRCATPQSEAEATNAVQLLQNAGYRKLMKRKPKPSTTEFHILSREYFPKVEESQQYPVTRIKLIPHTGR